MHKMLGTFVIMFFPLFIFAIPPRSIPSKKITAVITTDTPPTHYKDERTGQPAGFAVDLLNAIAKKMNATVEYHFSQNWKTITEELLHKNADVCPLMELTPDREKILAFTDFIESTPVSHFIRSSNLQITTPDTAHTIGAIRGSAAWEALSRNPTLQLTPYDSFSQGLFDLLVGQIDMFTGPGPTLLKLAEQAGVEDKIKALPPPLLELKRGIALNKNNAQLLKEMNQAINAFKNTKQFQDIYLKWYGKKSEFWTPKRIAYLSLFLLTLSVILMGLWRHFSILKINRELHLGRERLLITLRSIADGVITTDATGFVTLINPAAEELTGWSNLEAQGLPVTEIFSPINPFAQKNDSNIAQDVISTQKSKELLAHSHLISRRGDVKSISVSAAPILHRKQLVGVIIIFKDFTEKVKMDQEIQKIQKLESIGVLAGGIAHDFNNILTAILGSLDLSLIYLKNKNPDENDKVESRIRSSIQACLRAKELTHQLLTFSKGGAPVRKISSAQEIIREVSEFALRDSITACRFDFPSYSPPVNIDPGQIGQVFQNLVLNAIEAMPNGGNITIRGTPININRNDEIPPLRPGEYLKISLSDTGCGIPSENLEKIFDPYFTTKARGHGLGLAICFSIIKKHGGHISVESALHQGTTFHVYLPACQKIPDDLNVSRSLTTPSAQRILVIDGEESVLTFAKEMIWLLGSSAEVARHGQEAIDKFLQAQKEGNPFDVVILDLTVSGKMGGKETLEELKKICPTLRAILSSGDSMNAALAEFSKHACVGVLPKPYTMQSLSEALFR